MRVRNADQYRRFVLVRFEEVVGSRNMRLSRMLRSMVSRANSDMAFRKIRRKDRSPIRFKYDFLAVIERKTRKIVNRGVPYWSVWIKETWLRLAFFQREEDLITDGVGFFAETDRDRLQD